jgi:putative transcriptional regulator
MSNHRAPEEMLFDYAAGTLPPGPALAVAVHVALDPAARQVVDSLRAVAGALFEDHCAARQDETLASDDEIEAVLSRLDDAPAERHLPQSYAPPEFAWAPPVLARWLPQRPRWRRAFGGFRHIPIRLPGDAYRVSLTCLEPGRGLPQHGHVGAEFTVVMAGNFSDATGSYGVGDFAVGPGTGDHEPIAGPGAPCIALTVLERPVVLTGAWGRWMNPLVRRGML